VPDIVFGTDGKVVFPTKHHGEVTLSEPKWGTICCAPERRYYRLNGEKIATTLINPDCIRLHRQNKDQVIYYKKFVPLIHVMGGPIRLNREVYFAVIIDGGTKRVCTVYPVEQPKPGKLFVPPKEHEKSTPERG
jgi:hypothetical protein